jgi:hypothetical protein
MACPQGFALPVRRLTLEVDAVLKAIAGHLLSKEDSTSD